MLYHNKMRPHLKQRKVEKKEFSKTLSSWNILHTLSIVSISLTKIRPINHDEKKNIILYFIWYNIFYPMWSCDATNLAIMRSIEERTPNMTKASIGRNQAKRKKKINFAQVKIKVCCVIFSCPHSFFFYFSCVYRGAQTHTSHYVQYHVMHVCWVLVACLNIIFISKYSVT